MAQAGTTLPMGALYESNYMGDHLTVTTVGVSYRQELGWRRWFVPLEDIAEVRAPRTGIALGGVVLKTRQGTTYRARCWNGRKARRVIAGLLDGTES